MKPANRLFNVGFLGTGYIADWHAKALRSVASAHLAAVCDRDLARARTFAAGHGVTQVHASLEAMLAGGQLDVIHVLLPPDLHAPAAARAIDAGIHVLLEKPMATCDQECADLITRAIARKVKIGISHNFLFAPIYEQLRNDLRSGKLGRPDQIAITWSKGLDQLQAGPFDLWMLREPKNIMLEVGSHLLAFVLDLVGLSDAISVHATNALDLPNGARFFRRWYISAGQGSTGITLSLSFAPGFSEHSIHIRGTLASATADFERNTYLLHRHTKFGHDFDRYRMSTAEAGALRAQARNTFGRLILSKLRRSAGDPYGQTIARALQAFYTGLTTSGDSRLSPEFGREIVRACNDIGARLEPALPRATPGANPPAGVQPTRHPEILVLGATGFIGQELTMQLIAQGHAVRTLVRNPSRLPAAVRTELTDVVVGDLSREGDIAKALAGIRYVYHLARPLVKTWEEFAEHEIEATRRLARACLAAKIKRLIYTGTIDSYYAGAPGSTITEDTPLDPHIRWRNYYAQSKASSEQILMSLHKQEGLPVVIIRPGIVIGRAGSPYHWGIGMWSWNAVCQVWGQGRTPLPFVLVEDVARALVTALGVEGIEGESFNLVADTRLSALDYLKALEEHTGFEFQKIPTPPWKLYLLDLAKWVIKRAIRHPDRRLPSYRDWVTRTQRSHYDCSKARRRLNWKPTDGRDEVIEKGIRLPATELLV
jgi:nucleoside-diphosphate-sugar epimerase/predicted dehydrogenase